MVLCAMEALQELEFEGYFVTDPWYRDNGGNILVTACIASEESSGYAVVCCSESSTALTTVTVPSWDLSAHLGLLAGVAASVVPAPAAVVQDVSEASSGLSTLFSNSRADQEADSVDGAEPTMGEKNALKKAKNYLSFMAFSYTGLIGQLEFEGFSHEESVYAVDNCGADWYEQAARKANEYLSIMAFSRDGLITQLEFEGFTAEEAEYGVTAAGY